MRNIAFLFIALFTFSCHSSDSKLNREDALVSFSKLYGYVRYFHPSDEVANIDWDAFAIYGAKKVSEAKNPTELKEILQNLFKPIAPTLQISFIEENISSIDLDFNKKDTVYWQHIGNGYGNVVGRYKSIRVGRPAIIQPENGNYFVTIPLPEDSLIGKEVKFSASIKVNTETFKSFGIFWPNITSRNYGYQNVGERKMFKNKQWTRYSLTTDIPEDVFRIGLDFGLVGTGEVLYDSINVEINDGKEWHTIYTENFESYKTDSAIAGDFRLYPGYQSRYQNRWLYNSTVNKGQSVSGEKSLKLESKLELDTTDERLFSEKVNARETINKEIGNGLKISLPIALPGDSARTYPAVNMSLFNSLLDSMSTIDSLKVAKSQYARQGTLINIWSAIQHFYPYFEYLDVNWESSLRKALRSTKNDIDEDDFVNMLMIMLSDLRDGHVMIHRVGGAEDRFYPPLKVKFLNDSFIVTDVFNDLYDIKSNDIITKINGQEARTFFKERTKTFNLINEKRSNLMAARYLLNGRRDSEIRLNIIRDTMDREVLVSRIVEEEAYISRSARQRGEKKFGEVSPKIAFINLANITYNEFLDKADWINKQDAVIFDLRGYPQGGVYKVISHLMPEPDTIEWMCTPKVLYPDGNFSGYMRTGWDLEIKTPRIEPDAYFLINEEAASYTESIIGYIQHYRLGKMIGTPTAGINGNVNRQLLPGGIRVHWTGMKATKHDGSRHFGVGFEPDVHVERTIQGIREGRDEVLEKAIELAKSEMDE